MSKILHAVAFICSLLFLLSFIITHIVKSDLDWISSTLSMYALGKYGLIIIIGFYSIGLTQILISIPLTVDDRYPLTAGAILLFFAGTGTFLVAYFPTKPPPADFISNLPHIIGASIQFLMFPLAVLSLSKNMRKGKLMYYSLITGWVTLIFFFIIICLFFLSDYINIPFFGLLEKIDIIIINIWLILFSYYSYQESRNTLFIPYKPLTL